MKYILSIFLTYALLSGCTETAPEGIVATETIVQGPTAELTLYIPNENADGWNTENITINIIAPEDILAALQQRGIIVLDAAIQEFRQEDNILSIDFNTPFAQQVCSAGTAGEMMIIGSIVNTFLSTYQAEAVYITVNGEILETGHVIYDFPITFME